MSSGWLRRWARVVAALLLLTSLWQLPHRWQDDELCSPVAESHDESKHVFTAPAGGGHADHCAVCHWTRWVKPVFAASLAVHAARGAGRDLAPYAADSLRDPASDRLPPRAPPTAS
jgi:hypothetical protein